MMDDGSGGNLIVGGASASVGGILVWIGQALYQRFFNTESKANDQLVEQLSQRITSLEERQRRLESDLDEERRIRRLAEDKVHQLELDNLQLRFALRQHNIDLPPSYVTQTEVAPAAPGA
jgi:hypothetical protein